MNPPRGEDLYVGRHLILRRIDDWEFAARTGNPGCVAILGLTPANEIILVEQFRPPVQRRVISLPAGLAGDLAGREKEKLAEAALREFEEETGYSATSMHLLLTGPSSPGLASEVMTFFRAEGVRKVAYAPTDAAEEITCHVVPRPGLTEWLRARENEGCLIDYKIFAALYVANLTV
jgi:ADP-ribose pyrophosphatase